MLKSSGWKFEVTIPESLRSFILLGVPHTSNFDFFPAMAMSHVLQRNAKFVIKSEWVKFPMGLVMKPLGAIGLDREKLKEGHGSNTDIMAGLFKEFSELVLMIAPEGTRKPTDHWKTGFYYIAQKAQIPIVCGFGDYKKKIIGTGPIIYPRDFESDMKQIMDFYQHISGKWTANFRTDVRFK